MNQTAKSILGKTFTAIVIVFLFGCATSTDPALLDESKLVSEYFNEDAQWHIDNIPFFQCSDKEMEQVYYYRWKLYKAHIRNGGENRYAITEFINHMGWDKDPFCTINAASMHHIYEGRWLKDNRYMDGYINYLFHDGGNNRSYSESIADAAYARYLVNSDSAFIIRQLDSMKRKYNDWSDHYEVERGLYYIPAMPDATEYTIASIDASGGKDGFEGGEAFRPTINSYMYGNANAISRVAAMKGDMSTSKEYSQKAIALKTTVERDLWNDSLHHFTDRFKVNNQYVRYWDFIRGRELAGMIPWYFDLPADTRRFNEAWKQVTDTTRLLGKFGLRTNEPSYEYYFKQYVYYQGQRGSQWNGPSWPYQNSQVITAMANLLNNYKQHTITNADYIKLLRQFTRQHYLPNGKINLVENYDPNLGGPIVYYYWSNHYNHSSYNNLIITGLCGIRPSESDTLDINPLVDSSIKYFCLQDVLYHGHKITVVYDKDGSQYNLGKGVTVFVDGKKQQLLQLEGKFHVVVGKPIIKSTPKESPNYALNLTRKGYPVPSSSINSIPDSLYQAVDGRIWYFPEVTNYWSTRGSSSSSDWFAVDFGQQREISSVKVYLYSDGENFSTPDSTTVEYKSGNQWLPVKASSYPAGLTANTGNILTFEKVTASSARINMTHGRKDVAITEIEFY